MRKFVIFSVGLATAVGFLAPAVAGTPTGQGAQKKALSVVQPGSMSSQCQSSAVDAADGPNGFAMLNMPGQVGTADTVLGEVSLKNAPADTTYKVYLVNNNSSPDCSVPVATLTTNEHGNGNAHIPQVSGTAGSYYVVLQDAMGNEQYASFPVTLE